jgi:uncharacterized protein YcbK (DUF882 family)
MKLSENFDDSEFKCKCCGKLPEHGMNPHLIDLLQRIRNKIGKSISITSGYRCQKHNAKVDGAKHSQHVLGNAADVRVHGVDADDFQHWLVLNFNKECKGIGCYNTFTHIDVRSGASARWSGK